MKYCYRLVVIFTLFSCVTQAYALNKNTCRPMDNKKIESAVKDYLGTNNNISYNDIVVLSKQCAQGFARATIHPKQPTTEDATIYLNKINGRWQVMNYGTDFSPEFLAKIPAALKS